VSLELAGYEGAVDADACYQDLVTAAAAWFMAPSPPPHVTTQRKKQKAAR
jgi:hypothetical protein